MNAVRKISDTDMHIISNKNAIINNMDAITLNQIQLKVTFMESYFCFVFLKGN